MFLSESGEVKNRDDDQGQQGRHQNAENERQRQAVAGERLVQPRRLDDLERDVAEALPERGGRREVRGRQQR